MPLEGGLYQWAKLRWGEMTGFLVAWNLWWYAVRRAGLALGKWFPNTGSIIVIILFGSNVAIRDPGLDGRQGSTSPFAFSVPAASLLNLNLLGKMAFGAFSGCEAIAVFSGECRDPNAARVTRKSSYFVHENSGPTISLQERLSLWLEGYRDA
jgi:L-asparagine transporter-like permease